MSTKPHPENALSATFVSRTKQPGRYADGSGLYLIVEPSGSRRWEQRLVIRCKRRTLGLGGFPLVSLAEARTVAIENRKVARAGGDPLAAKRAATGIPTFAEATARVFELRRPGWRSARHAEQWIGSLNEYAIPRLGAFPIDSIDAADVLTVLTPLRWDARTTYGIPHGQAKERENDLTCASHPHILNTRSRHRPRRQATWRTRR